MTETNLEVLIKIVGVFSALYIILQILLPVIQNLWAEGIAGVILIILMLWWLAQKN